MSENTDLKSEITPEGDAQAAPHAPARESSQPSDAPKSSWVKFDDDGSAAATIEPSQTQTVEPPLPVKMDALLKKVPSPAELRTDLGPLAPPRPPAAGSFSVPPVAVCPPAPARLKPRASADPQALSNHIAPITTHRLESVAVPLSERLATRTSSATGFNNGDIIVNALPTNRRCAWITKAEFKPELVPEELMATGLTLTVEEYVAAMQVLVHDVRFTLYNVCYKRLLLVWVLLGFFILLCLLFSGVRGLALFGGGVVWLVVNALGIFVCMWLKFKLLHMLERCIASINSLFFRHKILLGLDDRGKISCHKVHLIFVYFDVSQCIRYLYEMLENQDRQDALDARATGDTTNSARNGAALYPVDRTRMDIDVSDIIITGSSSTTRISQRENCALTLVLQLRTTQAGELVDLRCK
ncbi:uncharacterized protein [Dermacentor albipictus]|uniref:uncharacterized protein isoform X2 n=1 Tax=Dermacentor albipictus TaxID=60249 RepID=UPI0038FCAFC6